MAPSKGKARVRSKAMKKDNQYFVEGILDERTNDAAAIEFLVKWAGYPPEKATWEPRENISVDVLNVWNAEKAKLNDLDMMDIDEAAISSDGAEYSHLEKHTLDDAAPREVPTQKQISAEKCKHDMANTVDAPPRAAKRVNFAEDDDDTGATASTTSSHSAGENGQSIANAASSAAPRTQVPSDAWLYGSSRKHFLDFIHAGSIIGVSPTHYLLSHHPDPQTGVAKEDLWLTHQSVDADRRATWETLRQKYHWALGDQIEADTRALQGDGTARVREVCMGDRWLNLYDWRCVGDHLFIRKKRCTVNTNTLTVGGPVVHGPGPGLGAGEAASERVLGEVGETAALAEDGEDSFVRDKPGAGHDAGVSFDDREDDATAMMSGALRGTIQEASRDTADSSGAVEIDPEAVMPGALQEPTQEASRDVGAFNGVLEGENDEPMVSGALRGTTAVRTPEGGRMQEEKWAREDERIQQEQRNQEASDLVANGSRWGNISARCDPATFARCAHM